MAVGESFRTFVMECLQEVVPARAKRMFGGVGIYSDGHFFALIHDDRLYFKVDDSNRVDFERHGSQPFRPYGDERSLSYYEVPIEVLEDAESLAEWARKAIAIAAAVDAKRPRERAAKPRGGHAPRPRSGRTGRRPGEQR
jgi:DNA transformation protein